MDKDTVWKLMEIIGGMRTKAVNNMTIKYSTLDSFADELYDVVAPFIEKQATASPRNYIRRHIPNFCEHNPEDLVTVEFDTLEELLEIEWIKSWQNPDFHRFSIFLNTSLGGLLMVEEKNGSYHILGVLKRDVKGLHRWSQDDCDARKKNFKADL